jgi:hypothetical protein
MAINFQTTNPAQLNDRVTELQIALVLDETNAAAGASGTAKLYTAAGAIQTFGTVLLKTGTAGAMTLALPAAGAQPAGQDGVHLSIVALDAEAYVVTTPANGINGADDTMTWAAAIGNSIELIAYNGGWVTFLTSKGITLSEV